MLSWQEKDDLYGIIALTIGHDVMIRQAKESFNEATVDVVEDMIRANIQCNSNVKELLVGLVGGSAILTKGWLRKLLKKFRDGLKQESTELKGYACLVGAKSRWKSAIILSAT